MTREEFIENIQCWSDLIGFCCDEGCDYCDDVYDEDAKDGYFDDELVEMARNADDWRDLYRQLEDIPTGCDYYIRNAYDEWHGADDEDFDNYKEDILSWGDNSDIWDEEEEDDEDEGEEIFDEECPVYEAPKEEEDYEEPEEGCSLGELFTSCTSKFQTIEIEAEQERKREEREFEQFIAAAV